MFSSIFYPIEIISSEYLAFGVLSLPHTESRVKAPTRPVNINKIIRILAATPSSGVIPVESPAVLNADATSNIICIKSYSGSNTHIKNVATHKIPADSPVIINAFEIFSSEMLRLNACADFFFPYILEPESSQISL